MNYNFSNNKSRSKITKYERALLIGKRAMQIACGASPNVTVVPGQTEINIAENELKQRVIPLIIKRSIGNNCYEYWRPQDMEIDLN